MQEDVWEQTEEKIEECLQLQEYTENTEIKEKLSQMGQKISYARSLLPNLLSEEALLKKECLSLVVERTIFLKRFHLIEELGNKLDWQHELLAHLKPFVQNMKNRLRSTVFHTKKQN